jgi:hypothetical protein
MNNIHNTHEPPDFSLVLGGPLFQLLLRSRLSTPHLDLLHRRIIFFGLITWVPLLILSLTDFKLEIFGIEAFLLLLVLGPLMFFSPHLIRAKRVGLCEYGVLASRYVSEFDRKWLGSGASDDEPLIGSGDIQSLADLGNSFQVIRNINPFPFGKDTLIQLVVLIILPSLPLVLTMIPLDELIKKLIGILL